MSLLTIPFTFSAGAVIIASQHNSNFSNIYSDYNGNIDNTNIAASAAIAYTKLNLSGSIVNADINASAAIADSKLAQITTASKVSGAAITLLTSLPAGAGVVPTANLGSGTANSSSVLFGDQTYKSGGSIGGLRFVSNTAVAAASNTGDITITNTNFYQVNFFFNTLSGGDTFSIRFNNDTGSVYKSAFNGRTSGGALTGGSASATSIVTATAASSSSSLQASGSFKIYPQRSNQEIQISGEITYLDSAGALQSIVNFSGYYSNSANATSFRILATGGATFTGNVYTYSYALS